MSTSDESVVYTDGAARGNPGPAAFAFVLTVPGHPVVEEQGYLGATTNNLAEYTAMIRALERARQMQVRRLLLCSDSELMVKQMRGEYKVRNAGLLPLYHQAQKLLPNFDKVTFRHVFREQNARADELCNEVLDNPRRFPQMEALAADVPAPAPAARVDGRVRGLAYLEECVQRWRQGDEQGPTPREVIDQLWNLFREK